MVWNSDETLRLYNFFYHLWNLQCHSGYLKGPNWKCDALFSSHMYIFLAVPNEFPLENHFNYTFEALNIGLSADDKTRNTSNGYRSLERWEEKCISCRSYCDLPSWFILQYTPSNFKLFQHRVGLVLHWWYFVVHYWHLCSLSLWDWLLMLSEK